MSRRDEGFSNRGLSLHWDLMAQEDLELQKDQWLNTLQQAGNVERGSPYFPVILPPDGSQDREWKRIMYTSLPSETSIRLIRLYPLQSRPRTHSDLHQPIRCSLHTVDLLDKPPYTALSYSWGNPQTFFPFRDLYRPPEDWSTPSFDIHFENDERVSVSANLYGALLSLRNLVTEEHFGLGDQPDGVACPCDFFWIDALCINQTNEQEKASQVTIMHRIYKEAGLVNVWLGGSDPTSDIFCLVSKRLLLLFAAHAEKLQEFRDLKITDETIYKQFSTDLFRFSPITTGEWLAVYAFFSRSWFSRTWVVQELAFAEKAFAICGTDLLDLDELVLIQDGLRATGWGSQLQHLAASHTDIAPHEPSSNPEWNFLRRHGPRLFKPVGGTGAMLESLIEIFQVAFGLGRTAEYLWKPSIISHGRLADCYPHSLLEIIGIFHANHATDPRDKIFALLGMSRELLDGSMASNPVQIKPDYTASVRHVFTHATAFILHAGAGLEILEMKTERTDDLPDNPHDLPSWVPDFSSPNTLQGVTPWCAIDGPTSRVEVDAVNGKLSVDGHHVGTVETVFHYTSNVDFVSLAAFINLFPAEQTYPVPHWDVQSRVNYRKLRWTLPAERPEGCVDLHSRFEVLWRTRIRNTQNPVYPAEEDEGAVVLNRLGFSLTMDATIFLYWYASEWERIRGRREAAVVALNQRDVDLEATIDRINNWLSAYISDTTALSQLQLDFAVRGVELLAKMEAFEKITGRSVLGHDPRFRFLNKFGVDIKSCIDNTVEHPIRALFDAKPGIFETLQLLTSDGAHSAVFQWGGPCTLVQTSTGLMGNAPAATKTGDEIWLLPGLRSPAILRKVEGSMVDGLDRGPASGYNFIGTSYIHGIMHGEASKGVGDEDLCRVDLL